MTENISQTRLNILLEIEARVEDKILEPSNAALLEKLIKNADSDDEALSIAALGTTYKKTGFHFDKRLEQPKPSNTITYFKKNEELSFGEAKEGEPVHKLIIGDNYDALQNLLIQYRGQIDVIYIDPPYGKDDLGEFAETNYKNDISRDNLLSMLYFRLQLAKQLLSDKGVIFCSIDDKNQAYIKCLFDEIFVETNFIGQFIWKKKQGGGNDSAYIVTEHEYVITYAKKLSSVKLNLDKKYKLDDSLYPFHDQKGDYGLITLDKTSIQFSQSLVYEIVDDNGNSYYPRIVNGKQSCWRWGRKKVEENFNKLVFKNGKVYTKYYRPEGVTPRSLLIDAVYGRTETGNDDISAIFRNKPFSYPKPVSLINHLLSLATNGSSIILDFFAGSGTTGQAVLELNKDGGNRTFILCQQNEVTTTTPNGIAYDVTSKRLKRIMTGECYDGNKDFKWAKDNAPYGGKLDVYEIAEVANSSAIEGKTPFDVIDETLYGKEKFATAKEKIEWVCSNFAHTQERIQKED